MKLVSPNTPTRASSSGFNKLANESGVINAMEIMKSPMESIQDLALLKVAFFCKFAQMMSLYEGAFFIFHLIKSRWAISYLVSFFLAMRLKRFSSRQDLRSELERKVTKPMPEFTFSFSTFKSLMV